MVVNQTAQQIEDNFSTIVVNGQDAGALIMGGDDDSQEAAVILNSIITANAAQIDREISQVKGRLEGFEDNRSNRLFQKQAGQQVQAQQRMSQSTVVNSRRRSTSTRQSQPQGQPGSGGRGGAVGGGTRYGGYGDIAQTQTAAESVALEPVAGPRTEVHAVVAQDSISFDLDAAALQIPGGSQTASGFAYVAKGTYSLPVTLPAGQVRLDFARPSGDAQLSIIAVPIRLFDNTRNTAVVAVISIVIAIVFTLARKLSRSLKGRKPALTSNA